MTHYRKRCPVCGMIVFDKNLETFHSLDIFEYNYRGRGRIDVRECAINEEKLRNYWISRLEEVLNYLINK